MKTGKLILAAGLSLMAASGLIANPVNITIADGNNGNGATSPWKYTPGLGAGHEDNETEPGTYTGDIWDLEALVYNPASSTLSVIGTYDFKNGALFKGDTFGPGAIFIKGAGSPSWTYAYVLDFDKNTYGLYNNFTTTAPSDIPSSAPFSINTGTAHLLGTGNFAYSTGINDPFGLGLQRDSGTGHNEIDLGLNLLPGSALGDFYAHFTISCGNDDLEGHFVPDGGATATLLSSTLASLAFLRKKLRFV